MTTISYNPILFGGIKVKTHLEIIKKFGILLMLFILISAVAVSDNTYKTSVSVEQSTSFEDDDPAYTVMNTYTKEKDSPGIDVTCEISGSGERTITDKDGVIPTEKDELPAKSPDSSIKPPDLEPGESIEEFSDEVSEWAQYILDEDPLLTIEDFSQEVADIANVE